MWVAGKLCDPLITCAIPERFCSEVTSLSGAVSSVWPLTFSSFAFWSNAHWHNKDKLPVEHVVRVVACAQVAVETVQKRLRARSKVTAPKYTANQHAAKPKHSQRTLGFRCTSNALDDATAIAIQSVRPSVRHTTDPRLNSSRYQDMIWPHNVSMLDDYCGTDCDFMVLSLNQ